jgi:hypothetical protein
MKELLKKENEYSAQARKTVENDFNLEIQTQKLSGIYNRLIPNEST